MEGTHNEETEAIEEGDKEFKTGQGFGESSGENESSYPGHSTNAQALYPQQGSSSAHR
jgi:hypothetical protein